MGAGATEYTLADFMSSKAMPRASAVAPHNYLSLYRIYFIHFALAGAEQNKTCWPGCVCHRTERVAI